MNLNRIIELKNTQQSSLQSLIKGVKNSGTQQGILDTFLNSLDIVKNEETRFLAYSRIVNFKGEPLTEYLEKHSVENKAEKEDNAYTWVTSFHFKIYEELLTQIETEKLVSDFYLAVLQHTHAAGGAFCQFHLVWNHHLLNLINPSLEKKIGESTEDIIAYLRANKLLDLGHHGEEADRSYSVLIEVQNGYEKKSYSDAFSKEVGDIISSLQEFQRTLSGLEDPDYNRKQEYIDYLQAIIDAFSEKNCDSLVEKWSIVDEKWMAIDTPFQIVHPIEYYEDKYRKAVSPEWDIRIDDTLTMKSSALASVKNMYETLYDEFGRETYKNSYDFSLDSLNRTRLHICSTIMCYGSRLTGIYSAQVIPNDPEITAQCGKKIFAVPAFILEAQKNAPVMQLTYNFFSNDFLQKYKKCILTDAQKYYRIYDVETIGHEFGHTLWLDTDTEIIMNKKTGVFKDIEEFKATSGGLISFFLNEKEELIEDILVTHVMRCISLVKYKKVIDVIPYYAECLIHLDILFMSGLIVYENSKISINYTSTIYQEYKKLYLETYKKLALCYLEKKDAGEFLFDYAVKEAKSYNAKNPELRAALNHYYESYEEIGNQVYLENIKDL